VFSTLKVNPKSRETALMVQRNTLKYLKETAAIVGNRETMGQIAGLKRRTKIDVPQIGKRLKRLPT
jgi:hypothetical protein